MNKISVYIITYNEENKIAATIRSVIDWVDEVIVADSFSTDDTVKIATELGARIIQIPFTGFGPLRNQAVEHCKYKWIFSLDADERCTPAAQQEIISICQQPITKHSPTAYFIPRRNYLLGRWMKYSGLYPDYRQPQLFQNGKLFYTADPVHESYIVRGNVGYLSQAIWQFPFENLEQILHKANRYSTLNGLRLLQADRRGGFIKGLLHGFSIFIRNYFFRAGFLDGRAGFAFALGNFISTFYKYAKLLELQKKWEEPNF